MKSQGCSLRSLTRITYLSKLIGIYSLAAYLQLQFFWRYKPCNSIYRWTARGSRSSQLSPL
ncbi:hypothetical protein B4916_20345 [Yersinia intermedia]|nr:hypothetical protein B4916_20345 [Yersinia intermedia]